ncbi:MAG: cobalamin biosynthesis protein CobD [Spirochaetes bacterium]|nr:MAG: cobalamin biosynthesis protein CobD [Spirochaetota bacterium]
MTINILLGFFLDRLFGDPDFPLHPVVLIGKLISLLERIFYKIRYRFLGGLLLAITSITIVLSIFIFINYLKRFFYLPFSINIISVIFIYFLFCNKTLVKEAKAVYTFLLKDDINGARKQVGRVVGRDTVELDKRAIIRATIETIAENIVDGFTAPLFYLAIGGLPAAYMYKTINTLDSMVGYKNERYNKFGRASAKLDDAFNYIPARLNLLFIYLASGFNKKVFKYAKKYTPLHPSPNSGISESAFSALLGLALCGPAKYEGVIHNKAWLGENSLDEGELSNPTLILKAIDLYWKVVYVTLIVILSLVYIIR